MYVNEVLKARYSYWEEILDRKHWVMYLQPAPQDIRELEAEFKRAHNSVLTVLQTHAKAYMVEGKEPPAAIAPAVLNFADDLASGRTPVLRAGDYISVKNFQRQQPMK